MKSKFLLVGLLLVSSGCWPSVCCAQKEEFKGGNDGPHGIFNSTDEYYQFIGGVKKVAYGPNGSKELQAMVPMLNDIALNKPFGFTAGKYDSQASNMGMLSNSKIRQELEMVDHQYEELQKVQAEIQKRVATEIRGLDFSKTATITTQIKGIRDRAQKDLNAVFLPHQLKRLEQIQLQSQLRRRSLVDIITSSPVKDRLEITEDQSTMLRKEEEKLEEEIQKKIAKLREEAREQLLSKLKPEQEKQVKEMVGDAFEFEQSKDKKTGLKKSGKGSKK